MSFGSTSTVQSPAVLKQSTGGQNVGYKQNSASALSRTVYSKLNNIVSIYDFANADATDETSKVGAWLDFLIANPGFVGVAEHGEFLIDTITKSIPNGLKIIGNATFKATGSNRLNMLLFTGATGDVIIDGITVDGNNKVARPFEIKNTASATDGNVYISPTTKFINAKNNSPLTYNAAGCRVQGNFDDVTFEGEIDQVDNDLTSGAVSVGLWFDWTGSYAIKNAVVTSKARIKNVKNSNTVTADADGIQRMGPTTEAYTFTVQPGAYFENCKGRSIKSQVTQNKIDGAVIKRDAYDGLVEIDLQYAGGYAKGCQFFYDGVRVDRVLSSSTRLNLPSDCTFAHNRLYIENGPVAETNSMCFFWGTDNTDAIKQEGIIAFDNKVFGGSVDYMVTVYCANVIDTNRLIVRDNWAEGVAEAFVNMQVVYNNNANLTIVMEGNGCGTECDAIDIVSGGQLIVESDRCNSKIRPLPPTSHAISTGTMTIYHGNYIRVATEGGSGTDDLDTIAGGNYAEGDLIVLQMATAGQVPTVKNGTGNIYLAGSDFALDSLRDRLVLSYNEAADEWCEVSRSNNG